MSENIRTMSAVFTGALSRAADNRAGSLVNVAAAGLALFAVARTEAPQIAKLAADFHQMAVAGYEPTAQNMNADILPIRNMKFPAAASLKAPTYEGPK